MRTFLGMDVGSTKTHALIADETGRCLGFGRAGAGNYQVVGYDGLEKTLQTAFAEALHMAGVDPGAICGAGFGVAGYDFPSDRPRHLEAIASLGLDCPFEIVNDGFNGLFAGAGRGIGVNVTSGSSNNCRGRNRDGVEGRIVGNGATFGEFGGAHEIMMRGLQMVNYAWIQRIPSTALTRVYIEAAGARDEIDLMEGLSNGQYQLSAGLAVQVTETARRGDEAAREVLRWAGEELGWLAIAVARQISMQDDEVEIVQSGSVFNAGELISGPMKATILAHCPRARLIRLHGLPVVGAVILGMEQARFDGYAVRDQIAHTAATIVDK